MTLLTGIQRIQSGERTLQDAGRFGLVTNQSAVGSKFRSTLEILTEKDLKKQITCVFGPQHGYWQTEQDNMRETEDQNFQLVDGRRVPLFSLYSKTRSPLPEQLERVDTLVIDMQDIGCRVYTYMLTLAACLRTAAQWKKKVIVLDRPNPLGLSHFCKAHAQQAVGVEGQLLSDDFHSFVGWYAIPLRHGMSLAELGKFFITQDQLDVDYEIIPCTGLTRKTPFEILKNQPWTMPSPNIPNWESSFLFPAFVMLEGTNVSEGRGTTLPFQIIGAPWLDHRTCLEFLQKNQTFFAVSDEKNCGLAFRLHQFQPTFNKHVGKVCYGIQIHILNPNNVNLTNLGLLFLYFCKTHHASDFQWASPGYEYNFTQMPIDLILGDNGLRQLLDGSESDQKKFQKLKNYVFQGTAQAQKFYTEGEKYFIYSQDTDHRHI